MRYGFILLLAAFAMCMVGPRTAAAVNPLPCSGEHLVLVMKLPASVFYQTSDGTTHIDLGYKLSGCTGGKWVAVPSNGQAAFELPDAVFDLYLIRAGLRGLPPEPSYFLTFAASWKTWLWIVGSAAAVAAVVIRYRRTLAQIIAGWLSPHEAESL